MPTTGRSGVRSFVHVGVVVEDMATVVDFLTLLGFECGVAQVHEGEWIDRIVNLDGVRVETVMASAPDGSGELELVRFLSPAHRSDTSEVPANRPGIRHLAYVVSDLRATVDRVEAAGWAAVGEIVNYQDVFLLCYVRGPEGLIIELAEKLDTE